MITKMYSTYDKAVKAFMPIFFARSHGEALRSFTDVINDEKHQMSRHLHDYTLFYMGDFDDDNGAITSPTAGPDPLITGTECLIKNVNGK